MSSLLLKTCLAAIAFVAVNAAPAAALTATASSAVGPTPTDNTQLIAELITDVNWVERFQQLLTNGNEQLLDGSALAKATVFNFTDDKPAIPGSQGGWINPVDPEVFPIMTLSNLNLNLGMLNPCGIFAPHVHPRANEFFFVIDGEVDFGFILETGVFGGLGSTDPTINGTLNQYEGTLFPQGSIHWQINNSPDCKPAMTFEAFSATDPGTVPILSLGAASTSTNTTGEDDLDGLRQFLSPAILDVIDACLARCNTS